MNLNLRSLTREKRELQMMRLMPATLAAVTKIALTLLCCTMLMLAAAPAWADQCSQPSGGQQGTGAVGSANGSDTCGAVITVTGVDGNGKATFFTVLKPGTGNGNPYDADDDTLVGIQNNSGSQLTSITLSAPAVAGQDNLFGFDNDGACVFGIVEGPQRYPWCTNEGFTGYEGPDNTFSVTDDTTTGTVNFITPIPSGGNTWFTLEGTPDSLTTITQTQPTPPGVTTLFDFGPFNWKSTPAATTQNGNSLSITAIPVTAGTQIKFADGSIGNCVTYSNTGGNCRAFDIKCTGTNCDAATYFAEFSTAYDVDHTILRPGLAKGEPDCSIIPNISTTTFTNQLDFFSQTSKDPTTKGKSGGTGSCWFAVENVTYPNAKLSITKVAPPLVTTGTTLSYGLGVLNLGPGTATAVTVTDPVPASTTFLNSAVCFTSTKGITCQTGANSPCVLSAGVVTCTLGNLLPFSLKTLAAIGIQLNFTASGAKGLVISNTATVNDANNIPNPGVNSNQVKTTVCNAIVKGKCQ
jgi:uncharacterized repeat protein (TIGR01451 family)